MTYSYFTALNRAPSLVRAWILFLGIAAGIAGCSNDSLSIVKQSGFLLIPFRAQMDFQSILLSKSARQRGKIVIWLVIYILPESVRKVLFVSSYTLYVTFILPFFDRNVIWGISCLCLPSQSSEFLTQSLMSSIIQHLQQEQL